MQDADEKLKKNYARQNQRENKKFTAKNLMQQKNAQNNGSKSESNCRFETMATKE